MNIHLSQRHPHADGVTPDTALFQQALDELAEAGGGTLVVDHGRYALGGLRIGSKSLPVAVAGRQADRQRKRR